MSTIRFALSICLLLASCVLIVAQSQTFTREDLEYVVDLPSPQWQAVKRNDVKHYAEFVYGDDDLSGHLRLRKLLVSSGTSPAKMFRREEEWELQRLPGYIVCSQCKSESFEGQLVGVAFTYEYASDGTLMYGRIYYLQVDKVTYYSLHFTVARERLTGVQEQMDIIARSFRLK